MKNKTLAFGLNFLLPGAGFVYLGRWTMAVLNFGAVLLIGIVLAFVMPESFWDGIGRYLGFGLGGGSGALAMQTAEQMNAEAERTPSMEELSEQADYS